MKKLFRRRSARTGEFVSEAAAAADPAGTVVELIDHVHMASLELVSTLRATGDDALLCSMSMAAFDRLVDALGD